jgi:hypothetical protein
MALSLIALAFVDAFLLSLVLPALFLPSSINSPVSLFIGVRTVRFILFVGAMVCLFGVCPYVLFSFYKILRLEKATQHFIRSKIQVIMVDIETASLGVKDEDTLKTLSHAFEACKDTVENIPSQINHAAPTFVTPRLDALERTKRKVPDIETTKK